MPVKKSAREKSENEVKSGREKKRVSVKKPVKWPKMAFTGTFDFNGEKKRCKLPARD